MNRQHGFAEIEIGGKKRPVKYGWNALALLEERCKVNVLEPGGLDSLLTSVVFQTDIVDVGLREGLRVSGAKDQADFTREDIGDWLDEEGFGKLKEFTSLFREAVVDSSAKGMTDEEKARLKNLAGLMSEKSPSASSASARESSGT